MKTKEQLIETKEAPARCYECRRYFSELNDFPLIKIVGLTKRDYKGLLSLAYLKRLEQGEVPRNVIEKLTQENEKTEHWGHIYRKHEDGTFWKENSEGELIFKSVNDYFGKLESLIGKTVKPGEVLPNLRKLTTLKRDGYKDGWMWIPSSHCYFQIPTVNGFLINIGSGFQSYPEQKQKSLPISVRGCNPSNIYLFREEEIFSKTKFCKDNNINIKHTPSDHIYVGEVHYIGLLIK